MSEQIAKGVRHYLKKGLAVCIEGEFKGIAATVLTTSKDQLGVELLRPTSPPFQVEQQVRIIYWDEVPIVCCWDAEVVRVGGPEKRHLIVSILGEEVQQRRFCRFSVPIPFSFTVVEAADTTLNGQEIASETQNISVGGLLFETFLPLKVGDKLALNLQLTPSRATNAVGWVVRSQPVQRKAYVGTVIVKSVNSIALEFLQLGEDAQIRLLKLLLQSHTAE